MSAVFYLDFYPGAHLITKTNRTPQRWNGWEVPNPTPREMLRFLDRLRPLMGEDEWWDTLSAFMSAYGNDRHNEKRVLMDEPTGGHMGFTWQARKMFDPHDTGYNRALASGHLNRTGHHLDAYYKPVYNDDEEFVLMEMVNLCCLEIPSDGKVS
jgi:hypothetical protein